MGSREEPGRGFPGERGEEGSVGGRGGRGGTGGEGGQAEVSPRFNRALIVAGVVVLAVITTMLLLIQEQIQTTRARINQEAQLADFTERKQQELILEIRSQSRLNACLTLKLAKRHGVDVSGLDSPACKVFPNGAVVFPGEEKGSLIDPVGPNPPGMTPPTPEQSPGNGGTTPPAQPPGASPPPQQPDPSPGVSPTPEPSPSCINLPPPLEDVCLPTPGG